MSTLQTDSIKSNDLSRTLRNLIYAQAAKDRGLSRIGRIRAEHDMRRAILDTVELSPGLGATVARAMNTYRSAVGNNGGRA